MNPLMVMVMVNGFIGITRGLLEALANDPATPEEEKAQVIALLLELERMADKVEAVKFQ